WLFHSVLYPINDTRYLLAATPFLLLFAAAGCGELARRLVRRFQWQRSPFPAVLASACVLYVLGTFHVVHKESFGVSGVAAELLAKPARIPGTTLVSGQGMVEGMLISEMALRDRDQHDGVLRASKVLARSTWMGANYAVRYQTPKEVAQFL